MAETAEESMGGERVKKGVDHCSDKEKNTLAFSMKMITLNVCH